MGQYNEDPPPPGLAAESIHLHQSICENTAESGCRTANQVEEGISLL